MKRLDFTYSMIITLVLSAIGTYFATVYFVEKSFLEQQKIEAEKKLAEQKAKKFKESYKKKPVVIGDKRFGSLKISYDLIRLGIELNDLSNYLTDLETYEDKSKQLGAKYESIQSTIDSFVKQDPEKASEIKIAALNMQQARIHAMGEIKHMHEVYPHLRAINEEIPKVEKELHALLKILEKDAKKLIEVQRATYQLTLMERIQNSLNQALRFNVDIKNPELLIDRAKRDLAVFVTVHSGFLSGNATQGIEAVVNKQAIEILQRIQKSIPILESNIMPLIDSGLRIAKMRSSLNDFDNANKKLQTEFKSF